MPKMKTHKGTAKRFRTTGSGKIMRGKAFKSHIMTKKSQKQQAQLPSRDRGCPRRREGHKKNGQGVKRASPYPHQ